MTFKHGKFSDSEVLRSLEKVAVSKNLVVADRLTKSASELVRDMEPTHNLSHDIVKLCSELRRSGLHKHADDIEGNFVNYKRAQTLYEAFKETGEDVVDMAHPEGGHVFEDVEGKPEVMTIVERQQAALKMLKKEPTGKLSNAQALRALKLVFAATTAIAVTEADRNEYAINKFIKLAIPAIDKAIYQADKLRDLLVRSGFHWYGTYSKIKENTKNILNNAKKHIQALTTSNITDLELTVIIEKLNKASEVAKNSPSATDERTPGGPNSTSDEIQKVIVLITSAKTTLTGSNDNLILPKKYKDAFLQSSQYKYMVGAYDHMASILDKIHDNIENSAKKPSPEQIASIKLDCNKEKEDLNNKKQGIDNTVITNDNLYTTALTNAQTVGAEIYKDAGEWQKLLTAWKIP